MHTEEIQIQNFDNQISKNQFFEKHDTNSTFLEAD
jgi:hypothetical protein